MEIRPNLSTQCHIGDHFTRQVRHASISEVDLVQPVVGSGAWAVLGQSAYPNAGSDLGMEVEEM